MTVYRVPVVIRGYAVLKYPDGKATGDYVGGLPRDAEQEVLLQPPPVVCGAPLEDCRFALDGLAEIADPTPSRSAGWSPLLALRKVVGA